VKLLGERLPAEKARHSVFVAEYLTSIAARAGVDHDEAATAGLLHDLCRTLDNATMLAEAERFQIAINDTQRAHPNLLHGPVAAAMCRFELGIESEAVYEAIYWHTTGRPGLGRLGQALYVADFAEPMRKYPEAEHARTLLRKEGFDEALYFVAKSKLAFLRAKAIAEPMSEGFLIWVEQVMA
jgi:predicted HD superfamily hydrolase involved in NAD metabolism